MKTQPPASHCDGASFNGSLHFQQSKQVGVFRMWIRMNFSINKIKIVIVFKHLPVDYLVSASVCNGI
jgi:hypothetical protein